MEQIKVEKTNQFIYVQNKNKNKKIKKNKVEELNHLLVSSPPIPVNIAIYRLMGQVLLQFGKGLPINVETSCAFPSHHVGDPT